MDNYAAGVGPLVASGEVKLVAVDNASPDDSAAKLKSLIPDCEVITSLTNVGFGAGCNRAWPKVTTAYWMLLNPDVAVAPESLTRLIDWMDSHPRVAIASPSLVGHDGREHRVACPPDSIWRTVVEITRLHKLLGSRLRMSLLLPGRRSTPSEFKGWVPGTAMIVRAAAASEVGLLDPEIFMYGEDVEWCDRMVQAGWRIGYCSEASAIHDGGTSASATWPLREHVSRQVYGHLYGYAKRCGAIRTRIFAAASAILFRSVTFRPGATDQHVVRLRARCYAEAALHGPDRMLADAMRRASAG